MGLCMHGKALIALGSSFIKGGMLDDSSIINRKNNTLCVYKPLYSCRPVFFNQYRLK